ncbi:hypothetical protein [Aestuariispira insulae]|uniref:Uncharacterized protein n=1 Tax=Aestuariispira insulae TaxID=1461337 RepID=A0A3D9HU60_9PROT|nr:hypothetical protein [Aestuariispira insulae]RED52416.1 hypothetical protein DFP90_102437 [Aestuariispira insulae]
MSTLPERFIGDAREVSLGERAHLDFPPDDIIRIANDPAMRRELISQFQNNIQDPETRQIIRDYLKDLLDDEQHNIENLNILAEGVKSFAGRPAVAAAGGGVAAILAGVTVGSVALLTGGIAAMVAVGGAWTYLKLKANRNSRDVERLKRLEQGLENELEKDGEKS